MRYVDWGTTIRGEQQKEMKEKEQEPINENDPSIKFTSSRIHSI